MRTYDVTALGEVLIDFTESGISPQGNPLFEANPGGAPCNVCAMLEKLGHRTAFVGKTGEDCFGQQLQTILKDIGIETAYLQKTREAHTTLALIHRTWDGDRDFSFYRNPGADMLLEESEIPVELIQNSRIFHYGTLSMTHDGVRQATKKAIEAAENAGCILSFDPNLRFPLWKSQEEAREQVLYGLKHCNVLKISDNEIQWLTGTEDYTEGISRIRNRYEIPLIVLSMGKDGSRAYYKGIMEEQGAFKMAETIDTTGAGDTFMGCVLHFVLKYGLEHFNSQRLKEMLTWANGAAALITTRKGALRRMPLKEEIEAVLKAN